MTAAGKLFPDAAVTSAVDGTAVIGNYKIACVPKASKHTFATHLVPCGVLHVVVPRHPVLTHSGFNN